MFSFWLTMGQQEGLELIVITQFGLEINAPISTWSFNPKKIVQKVTLSTFYLTHPTTPKNG